MRSKSWCHPIEIITQFMVLPVLLGVRPTTNHVEALAWRLSDPQDIRESAPPSKQRRNASTIEAIGDILTALDNEVIAGSNSDEGTDITSESEEEV